MLYGPHDIGKINKIIPAPPLEHNGSHTIVRDYVVQMYLREIWDDPRLRYPDPEGSVQSIPLGSIAKIWTPDLFFNEREGHFHHIQKANRFVRIFPTGKVSYSSRLTLKMHCPMNFKYFPFDRQICSFELESYGFETKDMSLKWVDGNAIQVNSKLHMSNFILEDFVAGYCDKPTKPETLGWMVFSTDSAPSSLEGRAYSIVSPCC
ncbi:glutamate-gated chloride channel [Trichonephila clavipes]|nr:glutamate-gated chloride channel [Trichonephila clavipes]